MNEAREPTALQSRSLVNEWGELELSFANVAIPRPGPEDVLVRIDAAPINPSDVGLMFDAADLSTASRSGTSERPIVTARIPAGAMKGMTGRPGQSLPVGTRARVWSSRRGRPQRRGRSWGRA
jgi:NADPH2:quinone reductase